MPVLRRPVETARVFGNYDVFRMGGRTEVSENPTFEELRSPQPLYLLSADF